MQYYEIIEKFKIPIKEIKIDYGLLSKIDEILFKLKFLEKTILVVSDNNIYPSVCKFIKTKIFKLILDKPKADSHNLKNILLDIKRNKIDLIISIGSGSISDLCKLSSYQSKIPYIMFPTALSMNGYTSANASILVNNSKKSIKAHLPLALYFDISLLEKSPPDLTKAGIGDMCCIFTCQFDWYLSHLVLKTDYSDCFFKILEPYYYLLLNSLYMNETDLIRILAKMLIISGFSMYVSGGSYPASQGEHLISHYLEGNYSHLLDNIYHGEQIGVTTLTMINIQSKVLKKTHLKLDHKSKWLKMTEYESAKREINLINFRLRKWQEYRETLNGIWMKNNLIIKIINRFSLKKSYKDINLNSRIYKEAVNNAFLVRKRFTSLNIITAS